MGTCRQICSWLYYFIIWCWKQCRRAAVCLCSWLCCCLCRGGEQRWLLEESLEEGRSQKSEYQRRLRSCFIIDLPIKVQVTGRTADCENEFLKQVSDYLSDDLIYLNKDDFSAHFLLIFCPVVSRVGTDMQNALADLSGESKAILVMLHHIPKESNQFVDTYLQAHHPAVLRTVHACYMLEDGLFTCQVNKEAVFIVAEVIKALCAEG